MDIQIAALCDAATDSHGKLNILGTFDTINAGQLPAVHPQCSIALRLVFSKMEEGHKELKLNPETIAATGLRAYRNTTGEYLFAVNWNQGRAYYWRVPESARIP